MKYNSLIILVYILTLIYADEPSLINYEKLNEIETICDSQNFTIETNVKSIAYFDSFDKNSIIYISKSYEDFSSHKDERITGKFYEIEPNVKYYVRNYFYNEIMYQSVFKKYVYPKEITEEINVNDLNFIYLQKNQTYTFNFEGNKISKMITLSRNTLNSEIIIDNGNEEIELNKTNLYYEINKDFQSKLTLEVKTEDAFLEFLTYNEKYEILEYNQIMDYTITTDTIIINIPKNKRDFIIILESNKPFNYSYSYGFSCSKNYYYFTSNNKKLISKETDHIYQTIAHIFTPFKNISLIENEFISLAVNIEKDLEQNISISYKQYIFSSLEPIFSEKVEETYCKEIISNITELLDMYVFLDIAKNPPEIPGIPNYHHRKINLIEELENIETVNRTFYDFYQDIRKILSSTKDLHFKLYSYFTPKGIKFKEYQSFIPFSFNIKKYNGTERIFIKPNRYFYFADPSLKEFIENHLDIPLRKINGIDPFNYIQNWGIKYKSTKNDNAQFSYIIDFTSDFYLYLFPLDYCEININEYEFDDNNLIRMRYYISYPRESNSESNENIKLKHINEFYNIHENNNDKHLFSEEINSENSLDWDLIYYDEKMGQQTFKCKVDNNKKVNVIVQTNFEYGPNFFKSAGMILKCGKLFYSNNYPIIIIESKNGGGTAQLAMILHQILQIKTVERTYFSFRYSNKTMEYYKNNNLFATFNLETCTDIKDFREYSLKTDYYYNSDGTYIEHKRINALDILNKYRRQALKEFRIENKKSKNVRKPTDIIIFTDSYSYSATSGFIKGFQSTGGAIVVGYFGNPKIEGIDLFDGSQSFSSVLLDPNIPEQQNLENLGYHIASLTVGESFDDSFKKENPIPREYTFSPVDYRVDIYSHYSDDIYNEFIEEGLKIYNKFNIENYCNIKNEKLLMDNEICYNISGKEHAHGGYKCGNNNMWNESNCQPYYCDIGYYYDFYLKECVEDCKLESLKSYFIFEDDYNKELNIKHNIVYAFIFVNDNDNIYYYYESSEDQFSNLPKIGFFQNVYLYVNSDLKEENDFKFKIAGLSTDIEFENIKSDFIRDNQIFTNPQKLMYILDFRDDHILYLDNLLNNAETKLKIAEYNNTMSYKDIINVNDKYFSNCNGKIMELEKGKIYLIYIDFDILEQVYSFIDRLNLEESIEIIDNTKFLYLQKEKSYILDFKYNLKNIMIKLSRKTLNSEIIIKNDNTTLNSSNLYFELEDNFNGIIELIVSKDDALIEFLYKQPEEEIEILDFEKMEFELTKDFNLIRIPKNYTSKIINFDISSNDNFDFGIFVGYSIPPYSYYDSDEIKNKLSIKSNNFIFQIKNHYKDDIELMENEYYCIMIQIFNRDLSLKIRLEDEEEEHEGKDNEDEDDDKLEWWAYTLIAVGSLIVLALVIFLIIKIYGRGKMSNKEIEEKLNDVNEIKEL